MPNIALAAAFCLQLLMLEFIPRWLDASGAPQGVVIAYVGAAKILADLAVRAIEWRPGCNGRSSDTLARWACWLSAVALLQVPGLDVPRPAAPPGLALSHVSPTAIGWGRRCTLACRRPSRMLALWIAAGTFLISGCTCHSRGGRQRFKTTDAAWILRKLSPENSKYGKKPGNATFFVVWTAIALPRNLSNGL